MSFATFLQGVSPFGPIFGKELRTTSRRKRTYLLRVVYLGILLFALFVAYMVTNAEARYSGGVAMRNQQQSLLGQYFFGGYAICSVVMMGLLGPILTATAISSERLHKTLPVLLMTPITAWQIVAGKLFSRMLVALTLIGLGLPVLGLVRLLGGVELRQMLWAIALAVVAALSSAAIGLFFSTLLNRAYAVLILSFGAMLFLYGFVPFIVVLSYAHTHSAAAEIRMAWILFAMNPYFIVYPVAWPTLELRMGMPLPLPWCIGLHLAMTALLLICSAMILRRHARQAGEVATGEIPREMIQPPTPIPAAPLEPAPPVSPLSGMSPPPSQPPPIPLHYMAIRAPGSRPVRVVADNPILWRELRRPLLARQWQKIAVGAICIGSILLVYALLGINHELGNSHLQSGWACVFNFLFGGLVSIIASTTIPQERDSDTWTLLLATPISGYTIVWGKAIGVIRRLLWPLVFIAAHFLLFAAFGVIRPSSAFSAVWIILTFNSVWIATGVYFSLRFNKTTVAVIANLALPFAAYVVVFAVLATFGDAYDRLDPDVLARINLGITAAMVIAFAFWVLSLLLQFGRPRGAIGMFITTTLFLFTAYVMFEVRMDWLWHQAASEQVGWYVPYYFLDQIGHNFNQTFSLPSAHIDRFNMGYSVVLAIGLLYLLATTLLLTMTAIKFNALVGRARQKKRLEPGDL